MPRGRRPAGDVSAAVSSLQTALDSLRAQKVQLDGRIGAVEAALRAFNAPIAGAPRRGRPVGSGRSADSSKGFRKGSLKDHIHRVLSDGKAMRVTDVTKAVLRGGFKTKNKTLAKSVGIALSQMPSVQRVGRGVFKIR